MHRMALRTRVAREARFLILGFGLGGGSSSLPRGTNNFESCRNFSFMMGRQNMMVFLTYQ